MKYLRRFNESMENQIYQQVLDSIKDCFQEFEDNGWKWTQASDEAWNLVNPNLQRNGFSYHPAPHFKYIMREREDVYVPFNKSEKNKRFEFTGSIDSNGEILWEDKKGKENDEFQDFIIAMKRLHDETGLDFRFSYNNLGGDKRIIIQGKI
jgi:hypothetical protein